VNELWDAAWRVYPAAIAGAIGLLLAGRGLALATVALRTPLETPGKNLAWMRGFRLTVGGLALAGLAAGWVWQWPVLVAIAFCIGFEELIESSIATWALRREYEATRAPAVSSSGARRGG
jgi:hypothetical protein